MGHTITVVGMGPGDPALLTVQAREALAAAPLVCLRTSRHPTVAAIADAGTPLHAYDSLYDRQESFDTLYDEIVDDLVARAAEGPVCYAVPGHPLVAESTVQRLLARKALDIRILPGLSGVEATYALLGVDPTHGLQLLDALMLDGVRINPKLGALVVQVYNKRVAGQAKLELMRYYPDDHLVTLVRAASVPGEETVATVPLFEIDRRTDIDHLTSLYLPPAPAVGLERLREIVDALRSPGGCPWDIDQTHESLKKFMLEEAYEAVQAVDDEDDDGLCEELGDVLLQVYLNARIADEREAFDLDEVATRISDKLVFRHPHVFGTTTVADSEEVLANWEVLKAEEKAAAGISHESRLGQIPAMAALSYAEKVMGRAAKAGFDWPTLDEALAKVEEEWAELREALKAGDDAATAAEFGDYMYALVNVARRRKFDPEDALRLAVRRFVGRFHAMEAIATERGENWETLSPDARKALWQAAKERAPISA